MEFLFRGKQVKFYTFFRNLKQNSKQDIKIYLKN